MEDNEYYSFDEYDPNVVQEFETKQDYDSIVNYLNRFYSTDYSQNVALLKNINKYTKLRDERNKLLSTATDRQAKAYHFITNFNNQTLANKYINSKGEEEDNPYAKAYCDLVNNFGGEGATKIRVDFGKKRFTRTALGFDWLAKDAEYSTDGFQQFLDMNELEEQSFLKRKGVSLVVNNDGSRSLIISKDSPHLYSILTGLKGVTTDNAVFNGEENITNGNYYRFQLYGVDNNNNVIKNDKEWRNVYGTARKYINQLGNYNVTTDELHKINKEYNIIYPSNDYLDDSYDSRHSAYQGYKFLQAMDYVVRSAQTIVDNLYNREDRQTRKFTSPVELLNYACAADYYAQHSMDETEYAKWKRNDLDVYISRQIQSLHLANTNAHRVFTDNTPDGIMPKLIEVTDQKSLNALEAILKSNYSAGKNNTEGENNRVTISQGFHGDLYGTYITVNPTTELTSNKLSDFQESKNDGFAIFITGLFNDESEDRFLSDPAVQAKMQVSLCKVNGQTINIPGIGNLTYNDRFGSFYLAQGDKNVSIDDRQAKDFLKYRAIINNGEAKFKTDYGRLLQDASQFKSEVSKLMNNQETASTNNEILRQLQTNNKQKLEVFADNMKTWINELLVDNYPDKVNELVKANTDLQSNDAFVRQQAKETIKNINYEMELISTNIFNYYINKYNLNKYLYK